MADTRKFSAIFCVGGHKLALYYLLKAYFSQFFNFLHVQD